MNFTLKNIRSHFSLLVLLFIVYWLLFAAVCSAQNPDIKRTYHWYFGYGAGIDFSSGIPVADTTGKLYSDEGCATISDTLGNLLFYTNGDSVWNKNHQVMPNGTGLKGCLSSTQAALIVPKPKNSLIYYVFTTDCNENQDSIGLNYSIVDMSLNGGLGDVATKNILLFKPATEHLSAVRANNCIDVWIMSHDLTSNNFYAYLVTNSGVSTTPVITSIGDPNWPAQNPVFYWGSAGSYQFSPDAKKLVALRYIYGNTPNPSNYKTVELFDFDNSTGILSNYIPLPTDTAAYGASFSPDNSKLYITTWAQVYQYDMLAGNPSNIINSRTLIYSGIADSTYSSCFAAQIALDNKIYVTRYKQSALDTTQAEAFDTMAVINNPNSSGIACNFIGAGVGLGGKSSWLGLPNFIQSYFDTTNCSTTGVSENNEIANGIMAYPNPFYLSTTIRITNEGFRINEIKSICLFDFLGKKQEIKNNISIQNKEIKLSREELTNGIYFLKIETHNEIYSQKLIIIN